MVMEVLGVTASCERRGRNSHGAWSEAPPLREARAGHAVAVLDNSIYVMGGKGASGEHLHTTEVLDPSGTAWQPFASPAQRN